MTTFLNFEDDLAFDVLKFSKYSLRIVEDITNRILHIKIIKYYSFKITVTIKIINISITAGMVVFKILHLQIS